MFGCQVCGYSLLPEEDKKLYGLLSKSRQAAGGVQYVQRLTEVFGDVRDMDNLRKALVDFKPDMVFHMAAQPLVRESYEKPAYTYDVNVMGTVNILEAVRSCPCVRSFVNVTTDKVYENKERDWGYKEDERLDGYDPYSNSKSCSELVTETYRRCFFGVEGKPHGGQVETAISTVRAGNAIGGGDFARDRILPDCVRTALASKEQGAGVIVVRNPHSTRPYQHVLENLYAYLLVAMKQWEKPELQGSFNVGPGREDCITTGELTELFCQAWGEGLSWKDVSEKNAVHEAGFLSLDSTKIKEVCGYMETWDIRRAVEKTAEWFKAYGAGEDMKSTTDKQIEEFFEI